MSRTSTAHCDVCKKEISPIPVKQTKMQVVFTTEQDEGRSVTPYFEIVEMDICRECMGRALSGVYIFAHGAMGYNTYYFADAKQS